MWMRAPRLKTWKGGICCMMAPPRSKHSVGGRGCPGLLCWSLLCLRKRSGRSGGETLGIGIVSLGLKPVDLGWALVDCVAVYIVPFGQIFTSDILCVTILETVTAALRFFLYSCFQDVLCVLTVYCFDDIPSDPVCSTLVYFELREVRQLVFLNDIFFEAHGWLTESKAHGIYVPQVLELLLVVVYFYLKGVNIPFTG